MRLKVYISGPITKGSRNANFFQACEAEYQLMLAGFAPLNPARSIILPFAWQDDMPHELWLECDLPWVAASDAVLRLPGESTGADEECRYAVQHNIPTFVSIKFLEHWRDHRRVAKAT